MIRHQGILILLMTGLTTGATLEVRADDAVRERLRRYWAYQPVTRPDIPTITDRSNVKTPVDAFLRAKLDEAGLQPNGPADALTLVRRTTYDLTGLPPTPEEIQAFTEDASPDAFERLTDRLLASPRYGEKWGRHWLDLIRYAETNGYERDGPKPFVWRFRDYVVRSFNDDKPYDRFIREQLAGDEIPEYHPDHIIATGYYRLGLWDDEPADRKQALYDELDDIVGTTSQVLLGMTLNCARCHDHKGDPIPHADYYRMVAFFRDVPRFSDSRGTSSRFNLTDISPPEVKANYEAELESRHEKMRALEAEMRVYEEEAIKKMSAEDQRASEGRDRPRVIRKVPDFLNPKRAKEFAGLKDRLERLRRMPEPYRELALSINHCDVNPKPTSVLLRGNPHAEGDRVEPGFPSVLTSEQPKIPPPGEGAKSSGRRSVLVDWITSPENPSTARVMVNRLWQFHYGRGIVPTPNDFGNFGEMPTHPELLDWLASEFVTQGWSMKEMHRLLMGSAAYQMSSVGTESNLERDPSNVLYWRYPMRRLTAEEIRDSILAATGELNPKMFGPSVYPKLPREVLAGQSRPGEGWPVSRPEEAVRRSVYVGVKRSLRVPILIDHDQADTESSCPVRYTTTVPTQSLGMLNGEFINERAAAFARRLERESPANLVTQVTRTIALTTGRTPDEREVREDVAFVRALIEEHGQSEYDALRQYCLMALNTNEFIYLD